jgi:hypothetical protein
MKSKIRTTLLAALAAVSMAWQPVNAGFSNGDEVTLAGESMFRMASAGGFGGEHRAWMTQDALDNALVLANDRSPASLTVSRENGAVVLVLDGRTIATVDSGSAAREGLTVDELAQKWAQSIKDFLSNEEQTEAYVATLKNKNAIQASIALVERKMYAPAGMTFPITLSTLIISSDARAGDEISATIDRDIPMGHYVIPSGSTVLGELVDRGNDNLAIHFSSLHTVNGTVLPIDAMVMKTVRGAPPHTVCTYAVPSGMANDNPLVSGRIPAGIGIGTNEEWTSNILVFHPGTENMVIGSPMILELKKVTQVAVVMRDMSM